MCTVLLGASTVRHEEDAAQRPWLDIIFSLGNLDQEWMHTKDMMKSEAQLLCRWRCFSSFRLELCLCRTKVMDEEAKSCLLGVIVVDSGAVVQRSFTHQLPCHTEMAH